MNKSPFKTPDELEAFADRETFEPDNLAPVSTDANGLDDGRWPPEIIEPSIRVRLLSSARFIEGFVPPDYLIDGVLQRGFLYALTGKTGSGKTALALFIAYCKAIGRALAGHEVPPGRVLYLAGENPDDIRMRWIAMGHAMGFDPAAIDVYFIDGVFKISDAEAAIREQIEAIGPFDLIIVDTSAAFYEGAEENDTVSMGKHGRTLRRLTTLPGHPTVIVNCHPTKAATDENLIPRGGGAFVAEIDGNLTCTKNGELVEMHWQGKFRGPEFAPLGFKLTTVRTDRLVDSRGRQIPSVVARDLSAMEQADLEKVAGREEDTLLMTMNANPGASLSQLAERGGWPHKMKVKRLIESLKGDKLVTQDRKTWCLNEKGRKEAEKLQFKADVTGAAA